MKNNPQHDKIYRRLQRHLDRQAVGFPATRSGADLRLLGKLFTPEEARLALHLSGQPSSTPQVIDRAAPEFSKEQTGKLLTDMLMKGSIGWKRKDGEDTWLLMPLVVGMYEGQDGKPSRDFLVAAGAYMKTLDYGKSFLAVKPSQMRTIPVHKSIPVDHAVATYDEIRAMVRDAEGPFVVLNCICREGAALRRKPCKQTSRKETCLGFGHVAAMVLRRGQGREITRDEVLTILQQNQDDGLVVQPSNTQKPSFVCSCCGCCCGMLSFQKFLPHPIDFWTSNYFAQVTADACTGCGQCVDRCQVKAITMDGPNGTAHINLSRCIGCGLCVTTCPSEALRLTKKETEAAPPKDDEALYDAIMTNKKGPAGQWKTLLKVALKMRQ